ncbi:transposase [Streptomyces sp. NL15-2K]|uniref:transposase n=1 Tax=Streptomyces sp. NL15-2K TaxID=376149 RepID=UPI0032AF5A2C
MTGRRPAISIGCAASVGHHGCEAAALRPLSPLRAWLQGRGGQPEDYCHRRMLDAIRYLVADGISWRTMPADGSPQSREECSCRVTRLGQPSK